MIIEFNKKEKGKIYSKHSTPCNPEMRESLIAILENGFDLHETSREFFRFLIDKSLSGELSDRTKIEINIINSDIQSAS